MWQTELDEYVPPDIVLPERLKLDDLDIPETKLDIDVDQFHMGEDDTNKLRSMLDNLLEESNGSELLIDGFRESETKHLDNDLLKSSSAKKSENVYEGLLAASLDMDADSSRKTSKFGGVNTQDGGENPEFREHESFSAAAPSATMLPGTEMQLRQSSTQV